MNRILMTLNTVGFLMITLSGHAHEASKATYVGNAGVLIERGETKILFDAFYSQSYDTYTLVPDSIVEAMMSGTAPYDGIDAVFVSHVHGDHFSSGPTVAYLRAHEEVVLYGSQQVADAIASEVGEGDPLLKRVISADLNQGAAPLEFAADGLSIEVVAVAHAGGPARAGVQNLSWRVTLDGETTVMHLGDADTDRTLFDQQADHFSERDTTLALPPYWFLGSEKGQVILSEIIRAEQVIGVHVPAEARGQGDVWRERAGGDLFTDPGEQRVISAHED